MMKLKSDQKVGWPQASIGYPMIAQTPEVGYQGANPCGGCPCMPVWWKLNVNKADFGLQQYEELRTFGLAGSFILRRNLGFGLGVDDKFMSRRYMTNSFIGTMPCWYSTWYKKLPDDQLFYPNRDHFFLHNENPYEDIFDSHDDSLPVELQTQWVMVWNMIYQGWSLIGVDTAIAGILEYEYRLYGWVNRSGRMRCKETNLFYPWQGYQGRGLPGQVNEHLEPRGPNGWNNLTVTPFYP